MKVLLMMPMIYCRSNGYFLSGLCIGLFMSLLFLQIEIDEFDSHQPIKASWYPYTLSIYDHSFIDEYAPRINFIGKPRRPQKSQKLFVRPRYYFTELGIREKLFMGVLTSQEYLHNRGILFNKTVGHLVEKIRYFISIGEGAKKPNITLAGIVGFTDTRSVLKPFHVLKYIIDNYLEDYDYYYIVKDKSYINGRNLMNFIEHMSVSDDIYLGVSSQSNKDYCSLEAGILLSNSIVRKLKTNLDWCVKNTYSLSDDINLGRCLDYATKIPCTMSINGEIFNGKQLPHYYNFDQNFVKSTEYQRNFNDELTRSISIYPIDNNSMTYQINAYLLINECRKVERTLQQLREKIIRSSHAGFTDLNRKTVSWPVGNWRGNKPPGRFDVLRWVYFNETHLFMPNDFENYQKLIGSTKISIQRILQSAINKINIISKSNLEFEKLLNGYMKFDASRGLDYVLDLSFISHDQQVGDRKILKRVQVSKPLGKIDILPMPYVTENTRINMILIVYLSSVNDTIKFMDNYVTVCIEKKDKTSLMLVLVYNPESPSKGSYDVYSRIKSYALNLTDKYQNTQSKITWLSIRLPTLPSNISKSDILFKIAITDLVVQKFSSENLLLFVQTKAILSTEFLNRIRMNTIVQWQIYCPIPFVEYHPVLAYADDSKIVDMDLIRNHGRYDELYYETISFYKKDYQIMRKMSEGHIPIIHRDKEIPQQMITIANSNIASSIYELFINYSNLHIFRAVEPALKLYYTEINRNNELNENINEKKIYSKNHRFGHRGQLAKLIEEYHENQYT